MSVLCKHSSLLVIFQLCHHLVFHVFHKVSWCSGYHISLTPKRSRVRLNDKFSGSHPGSAKNIPLWDQRFSFLFLSLFLSVCTVTAIIAVVVFYWYWYLSILFVNSTYRIFYSVLFSLEFSYTFTFFSFLLSHHLIISVPYSLSFSLEGQSITHDAWSRINMYPCHVYLSRRQVNQMRLLFQHVLLLSSECIQGSTKKRMYLIHHAMHLESCSWIMKS